MNTKEEKYFNNIKKLSKLFDNSFEVIDKIINVRISDDDVISECDKIKESISRLDLSKSDTKYILLLLEYIKLMAKRSNNP